MASRSRGRDPPKQQAKRRGKSTSEYQKVNGNMQMFVDAMNANPGAVESLTREFKRVQPPWLDANTPTKNITADGLISLALNRIENDANEHNVLLEMLRNIPGTDQIVEIFNVTLEESSPLQRESAQDISKCMIVSGKNKSNLKKHPVLSHLNIGKTEHDSGLHNSSPSTIPREAFEYSNGSSSPPPGSIFGPHIMEGGIAVLPSPPLTHGASIKYYIPHNDSNPVPDTSGSVNTKALQPLDLKSDVTEDHAKLTFSRPPRTIKMEWYSHADLKNEIKTLTGQIDELKSENTALNQRVHHELDIQNEIIKQYEQLQKNAKANEEATRAELQTKEQELGECQMKMSTMEKVHEKECTKLQMEIASLQKKMEDDKTRTEKEECSLKVQLSTTESELHKAERTIAEKENKIIQLEKEILIAEGKLKDDTIRKLEERNKTLEEREQRRMERKCCTIL